MTDPFELHVLERLALTKLRGSFSPNLEPSREFSKRDVAFHDDRFSNQVMLLSSVVIMRDSGADIFPSKFDKRARNQ